jgi:osmotically-inducible protein OsmY
LLVFDVAAALALARNLFDSRIMINVDTQDGRVTLFGIVPSEAAKKTAEAEAGGTHVCGGGLRPSAPRA